MDLTGRTSMDISEAARLMKQSTTAPAVTNLTQMQPPPLMMMQQAVAMQQFQFQQALLMQQVMATQQAAARAATVRSAAEMAAARAAEISKQLKGSDAEEEETKPAVGTPTRSKSHSPSRSRSASRSKSRSPIRYRRDRSLSHSPIRYRRDRPYSPSRSRDRYCYRSRSRRGYYRGRGNDYPWNSFRRDWDRDRDRDYYPRSRRSRSRSRIRRRSRTRSRSPRFRRERSPSPRHRREDRRPARGSRRSRSREVKRTPSVSSRSRSRSCQRKEASESPTTRAQESGGVPTRGASVGLVQKTARRVVREMSVSPVGEDPRRRVSESPVPKTARRVVKEVSASPVREDPRRRVSESPVPKAGRRVVKELSVSPVREEDSRRGVSGSPIPKTTRRAVKEVSINLVREEPRRGGIRSPVPRTTRRIVEEVSISPGREDTRGGVSGSPVLRTARRVVREVSLSPVRENPRRGVSGSPVQRGTLRTVTDMSVSSMRDDPGSGVSGSLLPRSAWRVVKGVPISPMRDDPIRSPDPTERESPPKVGRSERGGYKGVGPPQTGASLSPQRSLSVSLNRSLRKDLESDDEVDVNGGAKKGLTGLSRVEYSADGDSGAPQIKPSFLRTMKGKAFSSDVSSDEANDDQKFRGRVPEKQSRSSKKGECGAKDPEIATCDETDNDRGLDDWRDDLKHHPKERIATKDDRRDHESKIEEIKLSKSEVPILHDCSDEENDDKKFRGQLPRMQSRSIKKVERDAKDPEIATCDENEDGKGLDDWRDDLQHHSKDRIAPKEGGRDHERQIEEIKLSRSEVPVSHDCNGPDPLHSYLDRDKTGKKHVPEISALDTDLTEYNRSPVRKSRPDVGGRDFRRQMSFRYRGKSPLEEKDEEIVLKRMGRARVGHGGDIGGFEMSAGRTKVDKEEKIYEGRMLPTDEEGQATVGPPAWEEFKDLESSTDKVAAVCSRARDESEAEDEVELMTARGKSVIGEEDVIISRKSAEKCRSTNWRYDDEEERDRRRERHKKHRKKHRRDNGENDGDDDHDDHDDKDDGEAPKGRRHHKGRHRRGDNDEKRDRRRRKHKSRGKSVSDSAGDSPRADVNAGRSERDTSLVRKKSSSRHRKKRREPSKAPDSSSSN